MASPPNFPSNNVFNRLITKEEKHRFQLAAYSAYIPRIAKIIAIKTTNITVHFTLFTMVNLNDILKFGSTVKHGRPALFLPDPTAANVIDATKKKNIIKERGTTKLVGRYYRGC
jgi:hypothetical protein